MVSGSWHHLHIIDDDLSTTLVTRATTFMAGAKLEKSATKVYVE